MHTLGLFLKSQTHGVASVLRVSRQFAPLLPGTAQFLTEKQDAVNVQQRPFNTCCGVIKNRANRMLLRKNIIKKQNVMFDVSVTVHPP